jgi:hypothetical protein
MQLREINLKNMSFQHPFQHLFEIFGKQPETIVESVNREARDTMKSALNKQLESAGYCILLKAPRAGHGKTHLLNCVKHEFAGTHEFIPLRAVAGSRIDMSTALDDILCVLLRALPNQEGLTHLDLFVRKLFAESLKPLVMNGEVPSRDPEAAIQALENRPTETLDFLNPSAVTALWAKENFELLAPRISLEISQRTGLSLRDVSFWVGTFFRFAATSVENPGRVRALSVQVLHEAGAESYAHERLVALLGLLTTMQRVVIVADEVEGFSLDEAAALRFASFIISLRHAVERVDFILSVNQDIWEKAFLPRLSDGLADRLTEITVCLEPLDQAGKLAILESRSAGYGQKMIDYLGEGAVATHARGVIRQAAELWNHDFTTSPTQPIFFDENTSTMSADAVDFPTTFFPEVAIAAYESYARNQDHIAAMPEQALSEQIMGSSNDSWDQNVNENPFVMDQFEAVLPPSHDDLDLSSERSSDRVVDLLQQFRERYGRA